MQKLEKIKRLIISRLFPKWYLRQQQKKWNNKWSNPNYDPSWRIPEIPKELKDAVESNWFPKNASVLDIGCGSDEVSTWLAEQGFTVLGIDVAEGAIQRARSCNADKQDLRFQTLDICRQSTAPQQFQIFVDRGCLHTIDPKFMADYVKNVAASCTKGARFLLFHKVAMHNSLSKSSLKKEQEKLIDRIKRNFQPVFEILETKPIIIPRASGKKPADDIPALAIRMIRS